ncbi:murein L,D-transpeptidase catalytic domain family protein [Ohtaekwangia kribbensis]|jgi:hypothetical protein|uniref:Murein L,D-transpeptidase catalytic domain family protein n=1 Tax=Ohtaekwangia kribbensis TaxID=688913 RepID=A0ABW3JYM7_9BACT
MTYVLYLLLSLYSAAPAQPETITSLHTANITAVTDSIDHTTATHVDAAVSFDDSLQTLYTSIGLEKYNLSYKVFKYAVIGYYTLRMQGKLNDKNLLSIIDFTKPSTQKRFYTIDLEHHIVKFFTYVSHGKNTGEDIAKSFSNMVHSNQSSLGFYVTAETYVGSKGYSLKLDGMEKGYNDNMRERAVVMHDAEYVSEYWIKHYGRLGRSQGCPALSKEIAREVIDAIKGHTAIFAYFNDENYLSTSRYLNLDQLLQNVNVTAKR